MLHSRRRVLCLFLIVVLLAAMVPAASASVKAKVKSGSAKFYRYPSTSSAHVRIKKGMTLTVSAVKNGWAKVKCKGITGYMKVSALGSASSGGSKSSAKKKISSSAWKSKVIRMNWFDGGSGVLKKNGYGYIYDIRTGLVVHIKRMGGSNHADVEPVSKSDTAKLKRIAGGSFDWDSHAVILYAGGRFVACAINTKPHGDQTIRSNGYNGQFCLHMSGSKTHGSCKVNGEHQSAINKAYRWAHP